MVTITTYSFPVFADNANSNENSFETEEIIQPSQYLNYPCFTDIGNVINGEVIDINGKATVLYRTFEERDEALKRFIEREDSALKSVMRTAHLEELSETNYLDYLYAIQDSYFKNEIVLSNEEYCFILKFFDIYENNDVNNYIKEILRSDLDEDEKNSILANTLPCNNSFVKDYYSCMHNEKSVNSFNVSAANTYAANNYNNTSSYLYGYQPNRDCANFCSQILIAGGESQVPGGLPSYGWWCVRSGYHHYYSYSWSQAHSFVNYHSYSSFQSTVYSTFTSKLKPGSFIGIDYTGDGSWEHVGYVTRVNSYTTNGYYNHIIAQHSDNYYAYASTTLWPTYEDGLCTYIVIRGGK